MTMRMGGRPEKRSLRIVVADGDRPYRERLVAGLTASGVLEVAATATNSSDAVIDTYRHRPDVVLLDLKLEGMSAAETTRHIMRAAPGTTVCLLAASESEPDISLALDAGARACLVKSPPPEQLATAEQKAERSGRRTRGS